MLAMLRSYFSYAELHRMIEAAEHTPMEKATRKDFQGLAEKAYAKNSGRDLWSNRPLSAAEREWYERKSL